MQMLQYFCFFPLLQMTLIVGFLYDIYLQYAKLSKFLLKFTLKASFTAAIHLVEEGIKIKVCLGLGSRADGS